MRQQRASRAPTTTFASIFLSPRRFSCGTESFSGGQARAEPCGALLCDEEGAKRCPVSGSNVERGRADALGVSRACRGACACLPRRRGSLAHSIELEAFASDSAASVPARALVSMLAFKETWMKLRLPTRLSAPPGKLHRQLHGSILTPPTFRVRRQRWAGGWVLGARTS